MPMLKVWELEIFEKAFDLCFQFSLCVRRSVRYIYRRSPGSLRSETLKCRYEPGAAPDARDVGKEETKTINKPLVAGRPWIQVDHVSQPTMTVYPAKGTNTGAAVVVFPGGGYQILAIDLEGTEICDWLTSKGVTCVLLKYRVPGEGKFPKSGSYPKSKMALQDAQRTVGLVRSRASELHIDPHKIE